ncbi:MAG: hypothetical protein PHV90_03910 [Smithella sp.]|jgi:hypothetical protein|nr:hypothetical protein [Smithella sp.]
MGTELINKDYYNQMGDRVLAEVLSTNKGYAKAFSPENTKVIIAPEERKRKGYGEFWPVDEPGTPDLPHPMPGKHVIEIYDPTIMSNQQRLSRHIEGELYHGMKNDQTFNKMREDFKANYAPEEINRMKQGRSWWSDANGKGASDAAIHDAYIRGVNDPSYLEGIKSGQLQYSPKQLDILNRMQNYIKTGQ